MSEAASRSRFPFRFLRAGRDEQIAHFVAALSVGAYAWTLHGLVGAMLALSLLVVAIALTNMLLLAAKAGERSLQISRWAWLLALLAALVIIGRPDAERDCGVKTSAFWDLPQLAFCTDKEAIRRRAHAVPPHEHLPY